MAGFVSLQIRRSTPKDCVENQAKLICHLSSTGPTRCRFFSSDSSAYSVLNSKAVFPESGLGKCTPWHGPLRAGPLSARRLNVNHTLTTHPLLSVELSAAGSSVFLNKNIGLNQEPSRQVFLINTIQQRFFAGQAGGCKRKKRSKIAKTPHQNSGLGKRMEFWWPEEARRTRVPLIENSRQHVIYDSAYRRWMTMWYKNGIQVFKRAGSHKSRSENFERARMRAILMYHQLKNAKKLGKPKPDITFSGVRGVIWDKVESAWVTRWGESGIQRWNVFHVDENNSFQDSYANAIKNRMQILERNHQFVMQRNRFRNAKHRIGTNRT